MSSPQIHPTLAAALAARGYDNLTPVQQAVLEPETAGRDLLVSARTGSGKTVAYGLVLAENLMGPNGLPPAGTPAALVIAPTRELAMQVERELQWLYADAKVVSCVGGMDPRAERRALERGCHIVVGTPGRLRDHLERGALVLDQLACVILDEADEMLDLGFKEELEEILDATPAARRTLLFSATLPRHILNLAATYQKDALRLTVGAGEESHSDIDYRAIRCAPSEIELACVNVLRFFDSPAAMVFCATREGVKRLHANLVERGFNVVALSGELTQAQRSHALQALRDRRAQVCVATDVAARGIDIPDLDLVIHADLPNNQETLKHRSGRTGRAGRKGVCVILAPHPRRRRLEMMLRNARIDAVWQGPPTAEEIRAKDQERLIAEVSPAADASEEEVAAAYALMAQRSPEAIATAYIKLARSRMPSPEDLADNEPAYAPREARDPSQPDAPRPGFEDAIWFRLDLGRSKNAEARWILPLLCRRGHITKREIGAIRIFDRETRFQITGEWADRFEAAALKGDDKDGGRIERLGDDAPPPPRDRNVSSSQHRKFAEESQRPARPPRDKGKPRWADKVAAAEGEQGPREPKPRWKDKPADAGAPYDPSDAAPAQAEAAFVRKPRWKDKPSHDGDAARAAKPAWKNRPARDGDAPRAARPAWKDKPGAAVGKPGWKEKPDFKKGPPKAKADWKPRLDEAAPAPKKKKSFQPKHSAKPRGVIVD